MASNQATRLRVPRDGRWDIQGLRAFAVVAVILDHLTHWPRGGFVGVDVFFVISGFLITGLLLREYDVAGRMSFVDFYRRRLKRIAPAAVVVVAVTAVAAYLTFNETRFWSTVTDGVWALLFSANWRFAAQETDYFQQGAATSPFQHYWSLGVEEQFYLVWPWLLLLVFAVLVRRAATRTARLTVAAAAIGVLSAASFVWAVHQTSTNPDIAYFSTLTRTWELGVGALIAIATPLCARLPDRVRPLLAWAGLTGMVASVWLVTADHAFPAPWAALPVLTTGLVIVAGTRGDRAQQRFLFPLTNRVSTYLGDLSYSLYLWHFPVIVIGVELIGDSTTDRVALGVVVLLSAVYSFHLVEDPVRRSEWLVPRAERTHLTGEGLARSYSVMALSMVVVVTVGVGAVALRPTESPSGIDVTLPPPAGASPRPGEGAPAEVTGPRQAALQLEIAEALQADRWPRLEPTLDEVFTGLQADLDVVECGADPEFVQSSCTWGDPDAKRTMVTIGSSASMTYANVLKHAIAPDSGWQVIAAGEFGCPFSHPDLLDAPQVAVPGCVERQQAQVDTLNRLQPEVVLISGFASITGALRQWEQVDLPESTKVLVVPFPPPDINIQECYTKRSIPKDCVGSPNSTTLGVAKRLALDLNAVFVDSGAWFCYEDLCPAFAGGMPTKRDAVHMTPEYGAHIAPAVAEYLRLHDIAKVD